MPDLPGSSACLSRSAAPNHPGPPRPCSLVASERVSGFAIRGRLAVVDLDVTRPKRIRLRCGSPLCSPGLRTEGLLPRTPGPLHVERAINMAELSSARQARLSLAHDDTPAATASLLLNAPIESSAEPHGELALAHMPPSPASHGEGARRSAMRQFLKGEGCVRSIRACGGPTPPWP